jgi:hypothetical protein
MQTHAAAGGMRNGESSLGTTAEGWWSRLAKLSQCRLFGRVLAATCDRLQEFANRMGVRRRVNLGQCPAR